MKKTLKSIAAITLAAISVFSSAAVASAKEVKPSNNSNYKIVMKNKTTKQTFKLKGENDPNRYDTIKADFYSIPTGSYKVGVYTYKPGTTQKKLIAKTNWAAQSYKDAKYDVTTSFYRVTGEINVHTNWITSKHINLAKENSRYKVVAENKKNHEFFEKNLSLNFNQYDAYLTKLDGLSRGKYDISVYKLNSKGIKVKKVAHSTYKCKVAKGLLGNVDINYFPVISKVNTQLDYAHKDSHDYKIVMKNIKTNKTYNAKSRVDFNRYDTDYAIIKHVPAGKYKILVYTNSNSLCTKNSCTVKSKTANVKVNYFNVPKLVEASSYKISK